MGHCVQGLTQEQIFLLEQARQVWTDRAMAKAAGVPWQEETITDILIRNIRLSYPGSIDVIPFSKPLEGESGADWLLSFMNVDESVSATMLVQAKRLDNREIEYPDIDRLIGKRQPPVQQIDQLIATAEAHNIPALYAFYNHVGDPARVPRTCGSLPQGAPEHVHAFGISIAAAEAVKAKLPDKTFDQHRSDSIPFHCLFAAEVNRRAGPAALRRRFSEHFAISSACGADVSKSIRRSASPIPWAFSMGQVRWCRGRGTRARRSPRACPQGNLAYQRSRDWSSWSMARTRSRSGHHMSLDGVTYHPRSSDPHANDRGPPSHVRTRLRAALREIGPSTSF
jgi:hypothetical protein